MTIAIQAVGVRGASDTMGGGIAIVLAREVSTRTLVNEAGARLPTLPVPIDRAFGASADEPAAAQVLGTHKTELLR